MLLNQTRPSHLDSRDEKSILGVSLDCAKAGWHGPGLCLVEDLRPGAVSLRFWPHCFA